MCDYVHYHGIRDRDIVTRKPHDCSSCDQSFPAGSRMHYNVGLFEGELTFGHTCQACMFAARQDDDTPLHLCHGFGHEPGDDEMNTWNYINATLAKGETPTVEGRTAAIQAAWALENA